jgi:hypothetical protein
LFFNFFIFVFPGVQTEKVENDTVKNDLQETLQVESEVYEEYDFMPEKQQAHGIVYLTYLHKYPTFKNIFTVFLFVYILLFSFFCICYTWLYLTFY